MIAALKKTKGLVYLAAQDIGCDPGTIYDRAKVSPAVQKCIADAAGMLNDICEMKMYQAILAGEQWAIKFRLNTQARDRGYGEQLDIKAKIDTNVTMTSETEAALMSAITGRLFAMEEVPDEHASNPAPEPDAAPEAGAGLGNGSDESDYQPHSHGS